MTIALCASMKEDIDGILAKLPKEEACLPSWWTNKLTISAAYLNALRDYITYSVEEDSMVVEPESESEEPSATMMPIEEEEDDDEEEDEEEDYSMLPPSYRGMKNAAK